MVLHVHWLSTMFSLSFSYFVRFVVWFDPVVSVLPGLVPDGFIYLRASPDTCHRRLQLRKRAEENNVSLDYLRGLHDKHENWLFPAQCGNWGLLSVSQL